MGVQAPKSAEPLFSETCACLSRKDDSRCIAHNDVVDVAAAVDKNPDLTTDFGGDLGQLPRKFLSNYFVGRESALVNLLEASYLVGL